MTKNSPSKSIGGFSIIEFMVAFAILGGLVLVLLQIRSFTQQSTSRTQANSSINTYNAKLSGLLSESAQTLSFSMAAQENRVPPFKRNLFDINGDDHVGGDEKVVDATYRLRVSEYFDHLGEGYPLGILRIQTRDIASGNTVTETLFKSGAIDAKSGIAPNGSYCITYPSVQCPFQPVIRVKPDCSKDSALAGKCVKPTWKFQIDYLTDPELASRMGLRGALSQNAPTGRITLVNSKDTLLSYRQSVVYAGSEALREAEAPTTGSAATTTAATTTAATTTAATTTAATTTAATTTAATTTAATTTAATTTAATTTAATTTAATTTAATTTAATTTAATTTAATTTAATTTAGTTTAGTTTAGTTTAGTTTAGTTTAGTTTAGTTTAGTTTAGTTTAGSTSGCFVAGTLIETLSGPRPIEAIQKGDWVWSRALDGTLEAAPVEAALQRTVSEVLDLHLSNGTRIRTTSEHPFWVEKQNDYLRAEQLLKGDVLLGFSTKRTSAVEVTEAHLNRQVSTRVFNLTVAGNHNYFAGGVLVHNKNFGGDCCGDVNLLFNGTQCCDIITGSCGTAPPSCSGCVFCVQGGSCACPGDAPGVKSGVNSSCPTDCKTCGCNCGGAVICGPPSSTTSGTTTTTGGTTTAGSSTTGGSSTGTGASTTATTGTTTGQASTSGVPSTTTAGVTSSTTSTSGSSSTTAGGPQISCLACTANDSSLAAALGSCVGSGPIGAQECAVTPGCSSNCFCCNGAVTCVTQPTCCNCQAFAGNPMDCITFAAPGCTGCMYRSTCGQGSTTGGTTTSSSTTLGL